MSTAQMIGLLIIALSAWAARKPRINLAGDPLSRTLFTWANTPFQLRFLYQSFLCIGAAGSGKTSGTGRFLFNTLLSIRNSGGLIIASKPEDRRDVIAAMTKAARLGDLIIFGPDEKPRCNFLDALGGDAINIVNGIDVLAELMNKSKGEGDNPFWPRSRRRKISDAVVMLKLAGEKISSFNIQRFISGAAVSPAQLLDETWKGGYHSKTLRRATDAIKSSRDQFDFDQAIDAWLGEWPRLDERTRGNILVEINSVLAQMNTGVVRDLIGTDTDVSPADMAKGKWILVDIPLQIYGESGRIVGSAWKYLTQRFILARTAGPRDGPICIWIDEAHNYISTYDAVTLAEQRSHKGVAVYLSQSVHSFFANVPEAFTKALLTNFGTKIFHQLGDGQSAEYASSLLGQKIDITTSGGTDKEGNFNPSFSEHYLPVLQPEVFLGGGLRTSGGVVDAIVIRPEPFASGQRYAIVSFEQS